MNLDIWLGCSIPMGAELLHFFPSDHIQQVSLQNSDYVYTNPGENAGLEYTYRYIKTDKSFSRPDLAYPTIASNILEHDMISFCLSSSSNGWGLYSLTQFVIHDLNEAQKKYDKINVFFTPTQEARLFGVSDAGVPTHVHRTERGHGIEYQDVDPSEGYDPDVALAIKYYPESCSQYVNTEVINHLFLLCKSYGLEFHVTETWLGLSPYTSKLWSDSNILTEWAEIQKRLPKPNLVENRYDHVNSNGTLTQGHFSDTEHILIGEYIARQYIKYYR